ncbi:MAG: DUF5060 domain-containing protein [Planctomycetota bacterium]
MLRFILPLLSVLVIAVGFTTSAVGDGHVAIEGELKQWHKVTLSVEGPFATEVDGKADGQRADAANPFTDVRMTVRFSHESGEPSYDVPGYFAADGKAAETSAESGNVWRAHLSPDKTGMWTYVVQFDTGPMIAIDPAAPAPFSAPRKDLISGTFQVGPTDKWGGRDFRGEGRLQYVGKHHLQFAGSGRYFLKAGADAPETLLAFADFDGTRTLNKNRGPIKTWSPHAQDWNEGDPSWKGGKGKGLIGAINYLSETGCNAFSFLTYNVDGDGSNVWPYAHPRDKMRFDVSKLDQWAIVFDHAQTKGMYLHFKLQETEIDDHRQKGTDFVRSSLDGGKLGPERRIYLRELIARYSYLLALNWNLGEETTQTPEEQRDMAQYIADLDPYQHLRVIHTFPQQQDQRYPPLLGSQSALTGASLQNNWSNAHQRGLKWINASTKAGVPWVVAADEQGGANTGAPPDLGYKGWNGKTPDGKKTHTAHDIRKYTLWGNLMAGGAGVEYYFGYQLPENDLKAEDWRSRASSWKYAANALNFFRDQEIPFWEMSNANALIGNTNNDNSRFCLAKPGEVYLVYLPKGGTTELDLGGASGEFTVSWFNPRDGGDLSEGSVNTVTGGGSVGLGKAPAQPKQDWLIVVRASK